MDKNMKTIKTGLLESLPLSIAISTYGLSYGVLANEANLGLFAVMAMSLFVFSGSVQMVVVAMISAGSSFGSVLITSILLNLRNLLYGAGLAEGLAPAKKWKWLLAFGVSDEPYVLGSSRFHKYGPDPLYFGVVTGTFYLAWIVASFIGAIIGNEIDSQKWGLDLAFPVTFVALLIPSLKERPIVATALTAVLITTVLEYLFPGNQFTIIIAGIVSPLIGLYLKGGPNNA
ncbi:AzlC family ABC transporter permease [Chengkuizengella axinellae]|uniref:AzlC family ABC transporter permease n=1 Tax=Chengkuizengella axinellae TaxID=3064388 RepID=A0ABT9J569_9BACL|nr:AzlC family ABC transporter permease [Chengkuizengella sp. 2205SS18-9]MDP5276744.1 AzlC family ABC transporter permease [Chengkuizengella sp. 2205SS18-9]